MTEHSFAGEEDPGAGLGHPVDRSPAGELDLAAGTDVATGPAEAGSDRTRACHEMLLRVAGRAPDGLMTRSRYWLAQGELGDLARAVAHWAVSQDAVLAEDDAALLSSVLTEADADPSGLSQLTVENFDPYPFHGFAPQVPLDLVGGTAGTPDSADGVVDQAAVEAVAAELGAAGLWRAWRFPADGAPWPPPKRVYVIEGAGIDESGLAARVAERLAIAGEADPQVEVCHSGFPLPVYQELARSYGELLWAAEPDPGIQLAAIFDVVDDDNGPSFSTDHPLLDEIETEQVVQYLYGAEPLLVTTSLMDDVLDSSQVYCVPMGFRTDGRWVWNEASAYYADQYQLAPDPGLLAYLRSNGYSPPPVDGVAVYRALEVLQGSAGDEVAWMFASGFDEPEPETATEP